MKNLKLIASVAFTAAAFWACGDDSSSSSGEYDYGDWSPDSPSADSSSSGAQPSQSVASGVNAVSSSSAVSSSGMSSSSGMVMSSSSVLGVSSSSSGPAYNTNAPEATGTVDLSDVSCTVSLSEGDLASTGVTAVSPYTKVFFNVVNNKKNGGADVGIMVDGEQKNIETLPQNEALSVSVVIDKSHRLDVVYNNVVICSKTVEVVAPKITATGCKIQETGPYEDGMPVYFAFNEMMYSGWDTNVLGPNLSMKITGPTGFAEVSLMINSEATDKLQLGSPLTGLAKGTYSLMYEGNVVCSAEYVCKMCDKMK